MPLPLFSGLAAWWAGLPNLPVDWETVVFLILGCWGAAIGVFSGMLMGGLPWGRSLRWLGWSALFGPPAVFLATVVVAMPVWAVLHLRGATLGQTGFVIMCCWFLISAAAGVEILDRAVVRRARPPRGIDDDV